MNIYVKTTWRRYTTGYFNFRNSRARLVTKGALGRQKIKFRFLLRKYESKKKTLKLYGLACIVFHDLCIERGYLVLRKSDLTSDHAQIDVLFQGK